MASRLPPTAAPRVTVRRLLRPPTRARLRSPSIHRLIASTAGAAMAAVVGMITPVPPPAPMVSAASRSRRPGWAILPPSAPRHPPRSSGALPGLRPTPRGCSALVPARHTRPTPPSALPHPPPMGPGHHDANAAAVHAHADAAAAAVRFRVVHGHRRYLPHHRLIRI